MKSGLILGQFGHGSIIRCITIRFHSSLRGYVKVLTQNNWTVGRQSNIQPENGNDTFLTALISKDSVASGQIQSSSRQKR